MNMESVKKWAKTKKARKAAAALVILTVGVTATPYIGPAAATQLGAILGGLVLP